MEDKKNKCFWRYDDYADNFKTTCKNKFCYRNGGTIYNGFLYCPFCGGVIEELK